MTGSFSVRYENPEHPDNICAVDWDCWEKERWIRSWKETGTTRWHREEDRGGELNRAAYEAILEKFGLLEWREEYPLLLVAKLSPAELIIERRDHHLPRLEILSDTPGDHRLAEEYE